MSAFHYWLVVLAAVVASATGSAATVSKVANSLEEALLEKGYADATVCLRTRSPYGAKHYWTVQYKPQGKDTKATAVAILTNIASAIPGDQRFIAFAPKRSWKKCADRGKAFVFWKDEDFDWRLVEGEGVAYFQRYLEQMTPEQRGTVDEAYVVFSRAGAESMANQVDDAIASYLRVVELSEGAGKSGDGLVLLALFYLTQAYMDVEDETNTTRFLQRYSLASQNRVEKINYMPMIKVAPAYPRRAMERGIRGRVVVEFTVETDGSTSGPVVVEEDPQGMGFGEAAIEATRGFRYVPAVDNGELVRVEGVRNLINFDFK